MLKFEDLKNVAGNILEKGKELGNTAVEKGGTAIKEAKVNLEILSLKKEIKMSKIKLGDMIYQLDVKTGDKDIEELKKMIKNSLEELKYIESKKSK